MELTRYASPEHAASAVRHGRSGYLLAVADPMLRWSVRDYCYSTKTEALAAARVAITMAGDASRVVLLNKHNARVHVPVPRAPKGGVR